MPQNKSEKNQKFWWYLFIAVKDQSYGWFCSGYQDFNVQQNVWLHRGSQNYKTHPSRHIPEMFKWISSF